MTMKKILLTLAICSTQLSIAQSVDSYIFKVETGKAYTPLTTGTNITSGILWDDENIKIPLGFTTNIGGKTTSSFSILFGANIGAASDTLGVINTFFPFFDSDLIDRGQISGTAKSPLRYLVSGTSPNRIFKFEAFNAGFFDEADLYNTLNDSVNFQVWLYETSNIVEIRFGSSLISNPTDYFYTTGDAPVIGYIKDVDIDALTFPKAYFLKGNSSAPTVDSATSFAGITSSVSAYPSSGTVYRFIPKVVAASIGESNIASQFQVYPTITTDHITVIAENIASTSGRIMDMNGKVVSIIQRIEKGTNTIDLSHLASGNYVLEIAHDEAKALYKLTKQ